MAWDVQKKQRFAAGNKELKGRPWWWKIKQISLVG
jgi:hypothetical protein